MTENDRQLFLSRIVSEWTDRIRPAQGEGSAALQARNELLVRYHEAVYRFLHVRLVNDPHAADEIFSRFADALLEGEAFLKQASKERGRFCHYLKRILSNRITDYYRERGKGLEVETPPGGDGPGLAPDPVPGIWRQEVMNQAWAALRDYEQRTERPYHTVCHIHHSRPTLRSPQKAEAASKLLGRSISAENFRKLVQRGEELLADLVIQEVVRSLRPFFGDAPPPETVEEELVEFGLLAYCRDALQRYSERRTDPLGNK